jgi:hypothetical protein
MVIWFLNQIIHVLLLALLIDFGKSRVYMIRNFSLLLNFHAVKQTFEITNRRSRIKDGNSF